VIPKRIGAVGGGGDNRRPDDDPPTFPDRKTSI